MAGGVFGVDIIFTAVTVLFLTHKYGNIRKYPWVCLLTFLTWFICFSIIFVLPLDVSSVCVYVFPHSDGLTGPGILLELCADVVLWHEQHGERLRRRGDSDRREHHQRLCGGLVMPLHPARQLPAPRRALRLLARLQPLLADPDLVCARVCCQHVICTMSYVTWHASCIMHHAS